MTKDENKTHLATILEVAQFCRTGKKAVVLLPSPKKALKMISQIAWYSPILEQPKVHKDQLFCYSVRWDNGGEADFLWPPDNVGVGDVPEEWLALDGKVWAAGNAAALEHAYLAQRIRAGAGS